MGYTALIFVLLFIASPGVFGRISARRTRFSAASLVLVSVFINLVAIPAYGRIVVAPLMLAHPSTGVDEILSSVGTHIRVWTLLSMAVTGLLGLVAFRAGSTNER